MIKLAASWIPQSAANQLGSQTRSYKLGIKLLQTLPQKLRLQNCFKPCPNNLGCKTASNPAPTTYSRLQNCFKSCPNKFGWKTASNTQCQKPSFAKLLQTLSQQLWLQNFFKHCPNNIEPEPEWSGKPEIRRKSGAWAEIEYCNTGDATLIRI